MWASHLVRNGNELSISSWLTREVQVFQNVSLLNLIFFALKKSCTIVILMQTKYNKVNMIGDRYLIVVYCIGNCAFPRTWIARYSYAVFKLLFFICRSTGLRLSEKGTQLRSGSLWPFGSICMCFGTIEKFSSVFYCGEQFKQFRPDWKKNSNGQTCSCPRYWRLSASWGPIGGSSETTRTSTALSHWGI